MHTSSNNLYSENFQFMIEKDEVEKSNFQDDSELESPLKINSHFTNKTKAMKELIQN